MEALIKVFLAAGIISVTSCLSGKKPEFAGFIIALPMVSILPLLFHMLSTGRLRRQSL